MIFDLFYPGNSSIFKNLRFSKKIKNHQMIGRKNKNSFWIKFIFLYQKSISVRLSNHAIQFYFFKEFFGIC